MKKLFFVTGTRADFGKIKPLMRHIEARDDLELHILVTGMHMLKLYGSTYIEVKRENFEHVYCISNQHSDEPMCSILGNTVSLISRLVHEIEPDMIVIHGDRLEALAGATVGALSNTLVCHIEGGELSGTVDDLIRHSISKLSHIHMVANENARARLLQMGEDPSRIFIIGSPDLDVMNAPDLPSLEDVLAHYSIPFCDYAVSMFHPVTSEEREMAEHARQYFSALASSGDNYVVIYPNNDTGTSAILAEIDRHKHNQNLAIFPSVRFEKFLVLLKNARYMIGNSSAGIREAPFYGVPTVNVGTRQNRRHKAPTIFNCGYEKESVLTAIQQAKASCRQECSNTFGDGDSVSRFASAIDSAGFWETEFQKMFVDIA